MINKIPKNFQGLLWSRSIEKLDIEKNKIYIIHQLLAYGTINEYLWLFKTYGLNKVREIFTAYPQKDYYSDDYFGFIKLKILLIQEDLDKQRYVKKYLRVLKPYHKPKIESINKLWSRFLRDYL